MKTHRFIGDFDLKSGELIITDEEVVHQMWDVLKLRSGEEVILCDGQGMEAPATINERADRGIKVTVGTLTKNTAEPAHLVALYCAVLKKENFELVCQKATEAGVTDIIPVISERTVKQGLRRDRLEKIIREAAEQSGRGVLPNLAEPMELSAALTDAQRFSEKCFFDPSGKGVVIHGLQSDIALFVGPEGGWSPLEVDMARDAGLAIVSFGPRILRGETAAVIATFLAAL